MAKKMTMTTVKTFFCCLIFFATLQAITGHKGHHKRGQRHRVEGYQYSRPLQQHSSYGGSSYYGGYASSPVGGPYKQQNDVGSFRCSRAGFFSHETDCTRFYRCVDYYGNGRYLTLYRFVCAEGTIFDPSLSVCNHPSWISPPPKCAGNTSPIIPPPVVPIGPVYPSPPHPTIAPLQPPTKPPVYPSPPPATQAPFVPGPATEPQQPPVTLSPPVGAGGSGAGGAGAGGAPSAATEGPCVTEISISGELPNAPEGGAGTFPIIGGGGVIFPTEAPTATPPSSVTDSSAVSIGGGGVVSPATDAPSTESSTAIVTEPSSTGSSGVTDVSIITTDSSLLASTTPSSPSGGQQESSSPSPVSPIVSPPTASPSVPTVTSPPVIISTLSPSAAGGASGVISGGLPFMLVCGDQDLHQHPLRCDLFYQCIWNGLSFTINVYSCRAGQEFHEPSKTCRNPDPAVPCKAPSSGNSTIVLPSSETTTTTSTTTPASTPQYTLSPGSLYNCVRPGHFPYQLDCVRFYRCFEVIPGVLKGLLYRCPAGYGYSITTERCEKEATLPPCDRSFIKIGDFPIPMIPIEDTTVVSVEDFDDFFGNPNYLYRPRF